MAGRRRKTKDAEDAGASKPSPLKMRFGRSDVTVKKKVKKGDCLASGRVAVELEDCDTDSVSSSNSKKDGNCPQLRREAGKKG